MKKNFFKNIKKSTMITILAILAIANVFCVGFSSFLVFGPYTTQSGDVIVTTGGIVSVSNLVAQTPKLVVGHNRFADANRYVNETSLKASFDIQFRIDKPYDFTISLNQIKNPNVTNTTYPNFDITDYITQIGIAATRSSMTKPDPITYTKHNVTRNDTGVSTIFNTAQAPFNATGSLNGLIYNVDLIIDFKYTGNDFPHEVFMPMYTDQPLIGLELK